MTGGVGAALGDVLDDFEDEEPAAQGGLFEDLDAGEIGALDTASPLSDLFTPKGKGGRKPGSRNKRTEEVTRWLLSQGRHPILVMMEAYGQSPQELCIRIGILTPTADQLLDVFKLQLRMAEAVAPYVAQRQAQAIQLDGKGGLTIAFEGVSLPARGGQAGDLARPVDQVLDLLPVVKSDDGSRTDG